MQELYRIIDQETNTIVAEGMSQTQALETLQFYELDNPHSRFELEKYRIMRVKPGFGRDPDLH